MALVIKWPSKCPLGCLLPGCCLCGLVRFDVSLLPLGHSGTLENYFVASRPQSSMRKYDAVQGSSCVQNRLHSAVISSFWGPVPYLRTYPGWGGGDRSVDGAGLGLLCAHCPCTCFFPRSLPLYWMFPTEWGFPGLVLAGLGKGQAASLPSSTHPKDM